MNAYIYLGIAIVAEVIATSALKASEGFTRFGPSVIVAIGYGVAFYALSLTLKTIPVGISYAIWSGVGIILVTGVAWALYGQKIDLAGMAGIGLIIAGVAVINLFSQSAGH
ncbi:SMR family transporter [Sphingomonas cavernae]|uniref:QacE family quaternary ammonium compound efflux SMR transporter n=1 Tax=Sphingomonas cavernae TaxID=2320861 RepID=A0A418W6S0_9SPHN|nr:SMR family transporter [Sphingomonas cavernae]RJF85647.1 QacE family quaternary ammonium compound efflux SMR transporter [Sphingomonas cavernae]